MHWTIASEVSRSPHAPQSISSARRACGWMPLTRARSSSPRRPLLHRPASTSATGASVVPQLLQQVLGRLARALADDLVVALVAAAQMVLDHRQGDRIVVHSHDHRLAIGHRAMISRPGSVLDSGRRSHPDRHGVVGVAQLVELLVVVQAVAGSSPVAHPHEGPASRVVLSGAATAAATGTRPSASCAKRQRDDAGTADAARPCGNGMLPSCRRR